MCALPCRASSAWLTEDSSLVLLADEGFLIVLAEMTSPLILVMGLRQPRGELKISPLRRIFCYVTTGWLMNLTLSVYLTISSNSVVSTRGDFLPPRDTWQYLETFLLVTTHCTVGRGVLLASSR